MTGRKFVMVIGTLFLIALVVYIVTTPRGNSIPLTGIVDGNEVIVSPQITGRMTTLKVDEGSEVKKGDLIAELDPQELQANLAAAKANVTSLEAQVKEANHNYSWVNDQTGASIDQARAHVTSSDAQLEQARVALARDKDDLARMQKLFDKGEVSAQDRDHAEATVKMSQANVDALEESAKAEAAGLNVAQANRKQVDVRQSEISTTLAQLQQAARNGSSGFHRSLGTRKFTRRSTESFRCASPSRARSSRKARPSSSWSTWITFGSGPMSRKATSIPSSSGRPFAYSFPREKSARARFFSRAWKAILPRSAM